MKKGTDHFTEMATTAFWGIDLNFHLSNPILKSPQPPFSKWGREGIFNIQSKLFYSSNFRYPLLIPSMEAIIFIQHSIKLFSGNNFSLSGALRDRFIKVPFGKGVIFTCNPISDQHHSFKGIDSFSDDFQFFWSDRKSCEKGNQFR